MLTVWLPVTVIVVAFFPFVCCCWRRVTSSDTEVDAEQVTVPLIVAAPVRLVRVPFALMLSVRVNFAGDR